jgi:hypothetical protein
MAQKVVMKPWRLPGIGGDLSGESSRIWHLSYNQHPRSFLPAPSHRIVTLTHHLSLHWIPVSSVPQLLQTLQFSDLTVVLLSEASSPEGTETLCLPSHTQVALLLKPGWEVACLIAPHPMSQARSIGTRPARSV